MFPFIRFSCEGVCVTKKDLSSKG